MEDRRAGGEAEDEADDTEDRGDDCSKCTKLRNMLNASIQVQQVRYFSKMAKNNAMCAKHALFLYISVTCHSSLLVHSINACVNFLEHVKGTH